LFKRIFRYRLSPETLGYTFVWGEFEFGLCLRTDLIHKKIYTHYNLQLFISNFYLYGEYLTK